MGDSTCIQTAAADDGLWLRIDGRAMADCCPRLREFCETQLRSRPQTLFFVLANCEHFDSTFLGTLLCLQKLRGKPGGDSLVIVTPGDACRQTLKQMGGHLLFPIQNELPASELDWVPIDLEATDRASDVFQQQVVDAHCELATVPGPLGELYQPIAKMAECELKSRQSTTASDIAPVGRG